MRNRMSNRTGDGGGGPTAGPRRGKFGTYYNMKRSRTPRRAAGASSARSSGT